MRIEVAHDYLTQRGGAERVALELAQLSTARRIYTSVYNPPGTFPDFASIEVKTSWLQHIRPIRKDPRVALPVLPMAWSSLKIEDADVVLTSSTGFAHGVPVPTGCKKIVYCHNPPRWLYQTGDYVRGRTSRLGFRGVAPLLRHWDQKAAWSADVYVANSTTVADRIWKAYGISAAVVHPPVMVDVNAPRQPIDNLEPGYWLTVARGRGYKNVQLLTEAFADLPRERLVVAGSAPGGLGGANVQTVGFVSEEELRWLYANARGLVSVSREDFGLTPLEANAFGTPVAVLRAGGFLDSTAPGISGEFIDQATVKHVKECIQHFPVHDTASVTAHARKFSAQMFRQRMLDIAKHSLTQQYSS